MTSITDHERTTDREPRTLARELVARLQIELSPAAHALLRDDNAPPAFFAHLLGEKHMRDARLYLAHALPVRRALWWSCLCAHDVCDDRQPGLRAAIDSVVRYVQSPSETHRRAAEEFYRRQPSNSLAGVLSAAAFFSAGGVGPSDLATPIAAPAFVAPRLVSAAVYLASTIKDALNYQRVMHDYLRVGQQIAQGENLWPDADAAATFTRIDLGGPLHAFAGSHRHVPVYCQCEGHA
jgi:hypothetical protein